MIEPRGRLKKLSVRWSVAFAVTLASMMFTGMPPAGGQATGPTLQSYQELNGIIGHDRIGMQLRKADDGRIVAGSHYFYQTDLHDIALSGAMSSAVRLQGTDGSAFMLHFVCQANESPCDLDHGVGLSGTWQKGARTLPVRLDFAGYPLFVPGHRYEQLGVQQDQPFEVHVQRFQEAVLAGHRAAAARFIRFPLRVNTGRNKYFFIRRPEQLVSRWNEVFSPSWIDRFRYVLPHDMPVIDGMVMLGNGLAFVGSAGVQVVNSFGWSQSGQR